MQGRTPASYANRPSPVAGPVVLSDINYVWIVVPQPASAPHRSSSCVTVTGFSSVIGIQMLDYVIVNDPIYN